MTRTVSGPSDENMEAISGFVVKNQENKTVPKRQPAQEVLTTVRSAQTMSRSSAAESLKEWLSPARRRRCPESMMLDRSGSLFAME